jgi:ribosomal protein S18 acetylase RimI-like enzyme
VRPETELWIFSRGEVQSHSPNGFCATCRVAVLSLLDYMSTTSVPPLHPTNVFALDIAKQHEKEFPETGPDAKYPVSFASHCRHLLDPNVVTLGACHADIVQICTDFGLVREEFPGRQARLDKFLFKISDLPKTRELPEGLRWGEMAKKDIDMVIAQVTVPRTAETLMTLKSVAVFDEKTNEIVAWTFLGLDGSLTSLNTMTEYQGRGIAKAVTSKIFREWAGLAVDEEGNAWANADVYEGNMQSIGVCRSLGGQSMWKTYWVRIDIGKAGHLAAGE